jgi:CRISPR-associated protein Cas2
MAERRTWLIGYDITSPRRLRRVARLLEKHAYRVQYSLFAGCWTAREFDALWAKVAALIHPRRDDVRAWPVAENAEVEAWGTSWAQDGPDVMVASAGAPALHRLLRASGVVGRRVAARG